MANQPSRVELAEALERERVRLLEILPAFSEEQWRTATRADGWSAHDIASHLADSTYGLARIALGEAENALPTDPQTGWISPHEFNEQRRQKNRDLPREKVLTRMAAAFEHARHAIETTEEYDSPSGMGQRVSKGKVLQRIVDHAAEHRADLEALAGKTEGE